MAPRTSKTATAPVSGLVCGHATVTTRATYRVPPRIARIPVRPVKSWRRRGDAAIMRASPEELQVQQMQEAKEAAQNAIPLSEGVDQDDLRVFYDLLASTSYEEAQQKVVTLASSGNLTESVAEVAVQALQQCRDKGDNPQMEQTLDGLVQLIITALQQQMMSPALRLVEELVQMNPSENRQLTQQRLELEFATEGAVSQQELKEQMTQFFAQMDQQDSEFAQQVEAVWEQASEEDREQIDQMTTMRKDARANMNVIMELAEAC